MTRFVMTVLTLMKIVDRLFWSTYVLITLKNCFKVSKAPRAAFSSGCTYLHIVGGTLMHKVHEAAHQDEN